MSDNIARNKFADASSSVNPFTAAKAVDGAAAPLNRWVGSSPLPPSGTPAPTWLRVDLGAFCWINQWVVKQMGAAGWSPNFNLTDYKLQGSLDNANWFDIDSVTNNSANQTSRMVAPTKVRWVRLYITKGLRCNTNFASVTDFEVYAAPPTDSTLSALSVNYGTTNIPTIPEFVKTTNAYTASVGFDTQNAFVTPTSTDPNARITVNGVPVASGQASQLINLTAGAVTPINVVVTPTIGDPNTYTINVTRASSPYLTNVTGFQNLTPAFSRDNFGLYNATIANGTSSTKIIPYAEDTAAGITINGTPATSGQKSAAIPIAVGNNPVSIVLTSAFGGEQKTYSFNIYRQS